MLAAMSFAVASIFSVALPSCSSDACCFAYRDGPAVRRLWLPKQRIPPRRLAFFKDLEAPAVLLMKAVSCLTP